MGWFRIERKGGESQRVTYKGYRVKGRICGGTQEG